MLDDLLKDFQALRLHHHDVANDPDAMDLSSAGNCDDDADADDDVDHALLYLESLRHLRQHLREVMQPNAKLSISALQSGIEEERQLCEVILQFSQYCIHYDEEEGGFEVGMRLLEDYLPCLLSALMLIGDETLADFHQLEVNAEHHGGGTMLVGDGEEHGGLISKRTNALNQDDDDDALEDMIAIYQLACETIFSILSSMAWCLRWATYRQLYVDLLPRLEDSFHDVFFKVHPIYRLSLYAVFVGLVEHLPNEELVEDEHLDRTLNIVLGLLSTPISDRNHYQMVQSGLDCLRAIVQHPILPATIIWSVYMSSLEVLLMRCLLDSVAPTSLTQSAIHVSIDMLSYLDLKDFPTFPDSLVQTLVGWLHMTSLSNEIVPHVFSALSEMTLYLQGSVLMYLPSMFEAMHYTAKDYVSMLAAIEEAEVESREDELEQINAILYSILQCYSTIIMELKECDQCDVLAAQVMPMYVLLKGISRSEYWSIPVLQAAVGLIGDIVSALGPMVSSLYMDTTMLSLIQVALTSDEKTRDIALTTSAIISNTMQAFAAQDNPHTD